MKKKLKFSIITTCKNAEKYIEETVLSVVNQKAVKSGQVDLEYYIIDSVSNDNTVDIIKKLQSNHKNIYLISEKDETMYEGILKGFKQITGDIVAYINAGDFYNSTAFGIVGKVFDNNESVKWLTGEKFLYNDASEITNSYVPYKYRSRLIQAGVYGNYLPFIQQESTFWRKELLNEVDYDKFKKYKLAGDYYLWNCFSKKNKIYTIKSYLAGFKYHENQISFRDNLAKKPYLDETKNFSKKTTLIDWLYILLDAPGWFFLTYIRKINFQNHFHFDDLTKTWLLEDSINQKKIVHAWATDFANNTGEGLLTRKFLQNEEQDYYIYNFNKKFVLKNKIIYPNKNEYSKKINLSFFRRYFVPIIGIFVLWFHFLKGRKIAYLNFLPLWNTFLITFLPPTTKFGPITGGVFKGKASNIQSFARKKIIPILYYFNARILTLRSKSNYIFSTYLLKKYLPESIIKNGKFDFVYNNLVLKDTIPKKEIDMIVYYRDYFTKANPFFKKLIHRMSKDKDLKFKYLGDKVENTEKNYLGRLSHAETLKIIEKSKFSIASEENFSSLFSLECMENHLDLFCSEKTEISSKIANSKKVFIIDFDDHEKSINFIIEKIKENNNLEMYNYEDLLS